MINRLLLVTLFLLLTYTACFAQTSYQGITPGVSTRADVDRVLGPPVGNIADSINYKPPAGVKAVTVWYDDNLVDLIWVRFFKPIARSALIQKFSLPEQAKATRHGQFDGALQEYFGAKAFLWFLYASGEAAA